LKHDLTLHLHKRARELFGRGDDLVYYDVTNYYFEIDEQDELRRKGVSKEHRPDPIIQMGLLTDSSGIPITYDLFPGNCNDCETLAPLFREAKRDFGLGRVIVVADKGMNTGPNIVFNTLSGDGYVYAQSVRGGSAELKEYALSQRGYSETEGGFRLKSRQYKRKIVLKLEDAPWLADFGETADIAKNGRPLKTKTVYIDEKQVVIYSPDYDRRAKAERAAAVAKARDLVENPAKYKRATSYGAAKYVSNLVFDEETGAVLTTQRRLLFDEEKLREEELYDGYYAICTSEWRKKDGEILDIYQGLWRIEEAFRVSKSDLEARPVYLSREDRVKAHFLVCFIALVLARLLTRFLGGRFSVGRVVESLAKASGTEIGRNYYVFDHADEVTRAVCEMMGIDLERRFMRLGEIRALIGDTKKA
jgi:transposase